MDFKTSWLRQPSTITGIAGLVAASAGAVAAYLTGSNTAAIGVGTVVFSATHLFIDDNSQVAADMQALAVDTTTAIVNKAVSERLPKILDDVTKVVADLKVGSAPAAAQVSAGDGVFATKTVTVSGIGAVMKATTTGMLAAIVALPILAGCSNDQVQAALEPACKVDQAMVPIAGATLAELVPQTAGAVTIDQLLVHPAVVAYCKGLGGTPTSTPVSTAPAATPPAAAPVAAPSAG